MPKPMFVFESMHTVQFGLYVVDGNSIPGRLLYLELITNLHSTNKGVIKNT